MNRHRLTLMSTMLGEVIAGNWKPTVKTPRKRAIDYYGVDGLKDNSKTQFNLSSWVLVDRQKDNSCGFAACAVGHALMDERFKRIGLKVNKDTWNGTFPTFKKKSIDFYYPEEGFAAVQAFFGLDHKVTISLFHPNFFPVHLVGVAQAKQVKRRIDLLLALGEPSYKEKALNSRDLVSPQGKVYQFKPRF